MIRIDDGPIANMDQIEELPCGEIGELMVKGAVVTTEYVTRTEANPLHKIRDGDDIWHRLGDVGYLDDQDRFWFCGRKSHRLLTREGPMYTIPCEAIFNQHERIYRSALVGIGAVIEKDFEGGRRALEPLDVPIHALAVIADMSDGRITFAE